MLSSPHTQTPGECALFHKRGRVGPQMWVLGIVSAETLWSVSPGASEKGATLLGCPCPSPSATAEGARAGPSGGPLEDVSRGAEL